MKTLLKLFATLGSILFLSIFLLTIFTPQTIEKSAKNFIKTEIEDEVQKAIIREKIYSSLNLFLKKEKDKQFLSQIIADFVENEVYQDEGKKLTKYKNSTRNLLSKVLIGEKKIDSWIEEKYDEISTNLKLDIRFFSGINLLLFLTVLTLSFIKSEKTNEIKLPSLLLLLSTVICSFFYIFFQDWAYTLLYNSYTGVWYLAYVIFIFILLLDIAFNRGELTMKLIELILNILNGIANILSGLLGA